MIIYLGEKRTIRAIALVGKDYQGDRCCWKIIRAIALGNKKLAGRSLLFEKNHQGDRSWQ
ncbi:MAG: hypothetical protein MUE44_16045 [Oscillatoriaceae cyanobacterium Prado104]|jgi:hypothetical protein|nr:hypothetical protein [Oscillatoriaceae cyanobacterium Prado104]